MVDCWMITSSLVFLMPGYIHYGYREKFECFMYACVTFTSCLSDGVFNQQGNKYTSITTTVDRLVATCALLAAVRRGWLLRPRLSHKVYMLTGISVAAVFLVRGQEERRMGNEKAYRRNHMLWHMWLTLTGLYSALYRPNKIK